MFNDNVKVTVVESLRDGNNKRDKLYFLEEQCRILPGKVHDFKKLVFLLDELSADIRTKRTLVIGFAEAAIAIAEYYAYINGLPCVTTTRKESEMCDDYISVDFSEEHSHAPAQYFYCKKSVLKNIDNVIFIDDEITTGHTAMNLLAKIKEFVNNGVKFHLICLLNSLTDYKSLNDFDTYRFVFNLNNADINEIDTINYPDDVLVNKLEHTDNILDCHSNHVNISIDFNNFLESYRDKNVINIDSHIIRQLVKFQQRILVIGTEECIFESFIIADYLEQLGINVTLQAIVKTPLKCAGKIKNRFKLTSFELNSMDTFIYNLPENDDGFIDYNYYDLAIQVVKFRGNDKFLNAINLNKLNTIFYNYVTFNIN